MPIGQQLFAEILQSRVSRMADSLERVDKASQRSSSSWLTVQRAITGISSKIGLPQGLAPWGSFADKITDGLERLNKVKDAKSSLARHVYAVKEANDRLEAYQKKVEGVYREEEGLKARQMILDRAVEAGTFRQLGLTRQQAVAEREKAEKATKDFVEYRKRVESQVQFFDARLERAGEKLHDSLALHELDRASKVFDREYRSFTSSASVFVGLFGAALLHQRLFYNGLTQANSALEHRNALLRDALVAQVATGNETEDSVAILRNLVAYGFDHRDGMRETAIAVSQLEDGLGVSVEQGAKLAFYFDSRLKVATRTVGDLVATIANQTALASDKAAEYSVNVAKALNMMRSGSVTPVMTRDLTRYVLELEGAAQEVTGLSGEFQDLVVRMMTSSKGLQQLKMLGLGSVEDLKTPEGLKKLTDGLRSWGQSIDSMDPQARIVAVEQLAARFGMSVESFSQIGRITEKLYEVRARVASGETTLHERWSEQVGQSIKIVGRLANSFMSLVHYGLTPLLTGVNWLASQLTRFFDAIARSKTALAAATTAMVIFGSIVTFKTVAATFRLAGAVSVLASAATVAARQVDALTAKTMAKSVVDQFKGGGKPPLPPPWWGGAGGYPKVPTGPGPVSPGTLARTAARVVPAVATIKPPVIPPLRFAGIPTFPVQKFQVPPVPPVRFGPLPPLPQLPVRVPQVPPVKFGPLPPLPGVPVRIPQVPPVRFGPLPSVKFGAPPPARFGPLPPLPPLPVRVPPIQLSPASNGLLSAAVGRLKSFAGSIFSPSTLRLLTPGASQLGMVDRSIILASRAGAAISANLSALSSRMSAIGSMASAGISAISRRTAEIVPAATRSLSQGLASLGRSPFQATRAGLSQLWQYSSDITARSALAYQRASSSVFRTAVDGLSTSRVAISRAVSAASQSARDLLTSVSSSAVSASRSIARSLSSVASSVASSVTGLAGKKIVTSAGASVAKSAATTVASAAAGSAAVEAGAAMLKKGAASAAASAAETAAGTGTKAAAGWFSRFIGTQAARAAGQGFWAYHGASLMGSIRMLMTPLTFAVGAIVKGLSAVAGAILSPVGLVAAIVASSAALAVWIYRLNKKTDDERRAGVPRDVVEKIHQLTIDRLRKRGRDEQYEEMVKSIESRNDPNKLMVGIPTKDQYASRDAFGDTSMWRDTSEFYKRLFTGDLFTQKGWVWPEQAVDSRTVPLTSAQELQYRSDLRKALIDRREKAKVEIIQVKNAADAKAARISVLGSNPGERAQDKEKLEKLIGYQDRMVKVLESLDKMIADNESEVERVEREQRAKAAELLSRPTVPYVIPPSMPYMDPARR